MSERSKRQKGADEKVWAEPEMKALDELTRQILKVPKDKVTEPQKSKERVNKSKEKPKR